MRTLLLICLLTLPVRAEPDWASLETEALGLLRDYVRIRSINPPADSTEAAAFLQKFLEKEGIEVKRFESAPGKINLLARLPGRTREGALLMLHHMDVVPADPSRWPVDPFAAEIRDGFLYGRGTIDMKSVGVMQLLTMAALKRENVPLERDLLLLATCDEESGGEMGARWLIQHHWPEIRAAYVLDEGGFGTRDLLSAEGKLIFGVSVAEKKILWARLIATGTAGHGSQPVRDNPNDRLLTALARLHDFMRQRQGRVHPLVGELRGRAGKLADNKFTRAIQQDTLSITSLQSGVGTPPKVNVIPSRAEATLDFRLMPDTDLELFVGELAELWRDLEGIELEPIYASAEAPVSAHDTPMFRALEAALKSEYPEAVVTPYLVPFGTDSNSLRKQGSQAYGFGPAVVDASIVASMHSDAERIPIAQIQPALRIYYRAVRGYVEGRQP